LTSLLHLPPPPNPVPYPTNKARSAGRRLNDKAGNVADSYKSGVVLEKVCEYLYYNQKHAESKDVPDMEIPPELCLELLIAADYLDGESQT
jgi:hypothetical protein